MTPYFEFANPTKLCSGAGAVDNLGYELEILGVHNPLLLSDAVLEKIGTLSLVIKALQGRKIGRIFTDVPRDSSVETAHMAVTGSLQSVGAAYLIQQKVCGF